MNTKTLRYCLSFVGLVVLLMLSMALNVSFGSVHYSLTETFRAFMGDTSNATLHSILFEIRLPRTLSATVLGGGLAVSGYLLQTYFANPIATPYILGVSSGAKFCVALTMVFALRFGVVLNSLALVVASFVGSLATMGTILLVSHKTENPSTLIVCGVMVGYVCSAVTDFVVTFADDTNIVNLHNWSMGSFSGATYQDVLTMSILVLTSTGIAFSLSKPIGAYQLGETYAKNMGVNVKGLRVAIVLLSSVLSACVTAFAGPISFVGVAVPHLVKCLFKNNKPLVIVPSSFLGGAIFCLLCDYLARTLFAPTELSVSSVTAVFGVPVVLWVMLRRKER